MLAEAYRLIDFPGNAKLPRYAFVVPAGPRLAMELLDDLAAKGVTIEQVDFDTGEIGLVPDPSKIDGSGDLLYLLYDDPHQWIYLFASDLEWGFLFSNVDTRELLTEDLEDRAKEDFARSYIRRTTQDSKYYDLEGLAQWGRISGLQHLGLRSS